MIKVGHPRGNSETNNSSNFDENHSASNSIIPRNSLKLSAIDPKLNRDLISAMTGGPHGI